MKLPKAVLGAVLIGMTMQATTSCVKKDDPKPKEESGKGSTTKVPDNCPACGLG